MVYLDYSATSPLLKEARAAMISAMDLIGNPSALHTPGHQAMNKIEEAREEVAKLINASPDEIIFTSGGSESNNTITNIFAGESVAVSAIEHPSMLESAKARSKTTLIPVDETGKIDQKNYAKILEQKVPKLVSIMLVNNEIGTVEDVEALAKLAHDSGAVFHTDATQALGKIPIDVKKLNVDYMTISAHKIGGPVGIGALFVKKGSPFTPLIIGGHQEHGKRAGTYQVVNISGFGAAAKYVSTHNTPLLYKEKVLPLRNLLAEQILTNIPYSSINTPLDCSAPNILNCSFEAAEGESIQLYLDAKGDIIVSTGSACASGDGKPSHVIMATRHDAEIAHSSVRFSLGLETTTADVAKVMTTLPEIIKNLQGISTLKAGNIKKEDSYYA